MCQVSSIFHGACGHQIRYRLVNRCSEGFETRESSCKAGTNWVIAFRPVYDPHWCHTCYDEQLGAVYKPYEDKVNKITEQAEREDWSEESFDHAINLVEEHMEREVQTFLNELHGVQAREQNEYCEWRRRERGDCDSDAEEAVALAEESDSEDEARPIPASHGNERQVQVNIYEDSSDSGSETEGIPRLVREVVERRVDFDPAHL